MGCSSTVLALSPLPLPPPYYLIMPPKVRPTPFEPPPPVLSSLTSSLLSLPRFLISPPSSILAVMCAPGSTLFST